MRRIRFWPGFAILVGGALLTGPALGQESGNLERLRESKQCVECDLAYARLVDVNLEGAELARANFYLADLRRADLSGANLEGATLSGAIFTEANLAGANLP